MTEQNTATAAASGASATERFQSDKSPYDAVRDTPKERVDLLTREVLAAVHETVRKHKVTYDEYNALKAWMIQVGQDGEWPLFLDVWVEHAVEDVNTEHREGNKGSIEGPYYVPDAPEQGAKGTIPMRDDESGTPLLWTGKVASTDGTPLAGAKVELWHADSAGFYSQFAPGIPEWNMRGTFTAWRPAHLHVKVSAPDHELLTAQLYFPGDEHNEDDIASAVKPELILEPKPSADGTGVMIAYDFVLDPA
jgi:catechol 1,2-dioxygenase